jgi:drug/metabolite transporter (DMT)-like permease
MNRNALLGAAFVLFWSSGFIGAELGTRYAAADTLLAWRYVAAVALLWAVVAIRRVAIPRGAPRRQLLLGMLAQVGYLGSVVTGVGLGVPAGTVALIAALQPLVVAIAAAPLLGEHTTPAQRVGLGMGIVGVALVVAGDIGPGSAPWWAFALPVLGVLSLSAATVWQRRLHAPESPLVVLTLQATAAAIAFPLAAAIGGRLAPPAEAGFWVAVAWVIVLSTFGGYGSYLLVLRRSGATRVSTLLYLTPPTTMLWSWLMFGDVPGLLAAPGIALCAVGVWLVLRRSGARTERGRPEQLGEQPVRVADPVAQQRPAVARIDQVLHPEVLRRAER